MFYIVPVIIYKTIDNRLCFKRKIHNPYTNIGEKKLFQGSERSLQKMNI